LPPAVPSPGNLRAREAVRRLDLVVFRLVHERRAVAEQRDDLLSMLLLAHDEDDGSGMTDAQVRDELMTILLAGHETTANALSWAFYLLAKHPEVRDRLEAELSAVLGERPPTYADLRSLPYSLQVLKETMRLYPPAYLVTRRAARPVTIGPAAVQKNEIVVVDILGMHRRPDLYEDPLRFKPERFAPDAEKARDRHAFLPFGGGPRVCIGNQFALMEGQMALARLSQRFRFELAEGDGDIEGEPLLTLRPKGGVPVRVVPRSLLTARSA
jgi:cytochrome P450